MRACCVRLSEDSVLADYTAMHLIRELTRFQTQYIPLILRGGLGVKAS